MNVKTTVPVIGQYRVEKNSRARTARGQVGLVPAQPYQQRLGWLWNLGFSDNALAVASGLSCNAIWNIRTNATGQSRVEATRAARIATLTHKPIETQADFFVPALGARRRLQALQALGYSTYDIAAHLGVGQRVVSGYLSEYSVYGRTWQRIDTLYRELSHVPGPSKHAATLARGYGHRAPLDWDGLDLDDPDDAPDTEVAFAGWGSGATTAEVARRIAQDAAARAHVRNLKQLREAA